MSLSLQAIFVILMASLRHKNSRPGIARPGPIIAELSVQVLVRNAFKIIVLFLFSPFPPTTANPPPLTHPVTNFSILMIHNINQEWYYKERKTVFRVHKSYHLCH